MRAAVVLADATAVMLELAFETGTAEAVENAKSVRQNANGHLLRKYMVPQERYLLFLEPSRYWKTEYSNARLLTRVEGTY